ncbi:hypothetical protein EBZ39_13505 [bacterium]|nr:hypothetical protein [bacterium]
MIKAAGRCVLFLLVGALVAPTMFGAENTEQSFPVEDVHDVLHLFKGLFVSFVEHDGGKAIAKKPRFVAAACIAQERRAGMSPELYDLWRELHKGVAQSCLTDAFVGMITKCYKDHREAAGQIVAKIIAFYGKQMKRVKIGWKFSERDGRYFAVKTFWTAAQINLITKLLPVFKIECRTRRREGRNFTLAFLTLEDCNRFCLAVGLAPIGNHHDAASTDLDSASDDDLDSDQD